MLHTKICDILGVQYPIIQGGLGHMSGGELAAAVSSAGGLGTIALTTRTRDLYAQEKWPISVRNEIKLAKSLTNKPFAVNVPMDNNVHDKFVEAAIEEKVKVVVLAAGNPRLYAKTLKAHGIKVMQLVFAVRHAQVAEAEGVDAVIASGVDAGGFIHLNELPTLALVPQIVDAVKLPVIAAGGICDARGMAAAFALGAEGVQLGTRFIATNEALAHQNLKQYLVNAAETSTIVTGRKSQMAMRVIKNKFTADLMEKEATGFTKEQMGVFIGSGRGLVAIMDGNVEEGSVGCSPSVGMIKEILPAGEVVRRLVADYSKIVSRLDGLAK
ncbi:MAG: DUF561 domain-containing protein [Chloroflexi bacterium]|nr:DUF561 domain-containing protein [Chloroflexota bacterium]